MAMLAGPRRKQKVINLRAKNNAWSNDQSKFGQRMLEKMGWSSGKGLGAKEDGIVEHVVARYKNDDRGLGYEDKNDQWTKHEDDFNALLANLSSGNNEEEKLHSGVSLETKSKKSKARIHYHKFTRGKDIARYSEKDLANIFGKKSLKQEKAEETMKVKNSEENETTEKVFTEKGSMADYFKNKLASLKMKAFKSEPICDSNNDDYEQNYAFKGFATNDDESESTHQGFGFQSFQLSSENQIDDHKETNEIVKKKKKKSKKHDHERTTLLEENNESVAVDMEEVEVDDTEPQIKKKSKKKKKSKHEQCTENELNTASQNEVESNANNMQDNVPKRKSKKKKIEQVFTSDADVAEESEIVPHKKKKSKKVAT